MRRRRDNHRVPLLAGPALAPGSIASREQPVLAVDEFVMRPWRASDAAAVVTAYADPDIQRWHARSMTPAEASVWIDRWSARRSAETGTGWAIASESWLLGQISLRTLDLDHGLGEISYWVVPAARGQRVATRALGALSRWAFEDLGLHRLELLHSIHNPASCRVAETAGFSLEGVKRGEALHADGWHDMHLHGRLHDDPFPAAVAGAGLDAAGRAPATRGPAGNP
jgi:ribosomal-protein-alanine N-acetyltransferase